jgi:hypothetical protein
MPMVSKTGEWTTEIESSDEDVDHCNVFKPISDQGTSGGEWQTTVK